ncbi:MAG: radical SAM family heme chaperone HemW [Chloroflexi bacterium]|nr:radical SAM family heme chaperone HemW [Chloroflexota bacterium]
MNAAPHHLYVHVPFCRLVCAYCDFVTVGGRGADIDRYVEAVRSEIAVRPASGTLRTVYFGGGTPSLLTAEQTDRVMRASLDRWSPSAPEEVTLEANPSARERPDWAGLRTAGVNRVSLGVQSLDDDDLRTIARGHTSAEAREAYADVRAAGFENVSIDLIYGIPGQGMERWNRILREAVALAPDHVSLYALQLALAPDEWAAPPRRGALRWRRRVADEQDDDIAADQYRCAEEVLDVAGYRHYELSSWARPGRESRHNGAYWARRAYTGIGAGAHSYDGRAVRSWNVRDLDGYLARAEAGERPMEGCEELDEPTRAFEAVALGLRRVDGLRRAEFAAEFASDPGDRFADAVAVGLERGLLTVDADSIRLSATGRLLANDALEPFAP